MEPANFILTFKYPAIFIGSFFEGPVVMIAAGFLFGEDTDIACRRLAAEGVFRTGLRYAVNYFWVIFFKKAYSKKSTDIRG